MDHRRGRYGPRSQRWAEIAPHPARVKDELRLLCELLHSLLDRHAVHRSLVGLVKQPLLLRVLLAREIRDPDLARRDRLLGSFGLSLRHQDSRPIYSHLASECHKGVIRGHQ